MTMTSMTSLTSSTGYPAAMDHAEHGESAERVEETPTPCPTCYRCPRCGRAYLSAYVLPPRWWRRAQLSWLGAAIVLGICLGLVIAATTVLILVQLVRWFV